MKKTHRILALLLALVMCMAICVSAGAEEEKKFTLKLAGIKPDDDPATLAMQLFADEVNANSNGTITVKTFSNSALGGINDLLTGMINGTVEMMYNTLSCYSWLDGAKRFNFISAPFLWEDNDQLQAFLDSDISKQWMEEAATASGVRVLAAAGELPPRQLTANRAVTNAADFAGLKVRTAEAPIVQETMKRLGAIPVVVPFADLYMALRQNTVDAQENNFVTAKTNSFFEVQSHFMKTDYSRDVSALFIGEAVWEQLSDNQKAVVSAAAEKACKHEEELIAAQMADVMAFLSEKMTFVEPDMQSIREKLGSELYEEFDATGDFWPVGTIQYVLDFQNAYQK